MRFTLPNQPPELSGGWRKGCCKQSQNPDNKIRFALNLHTMRHNDLLAFLVAIGITGLLIWGLVYFVNVWWERLPKAVALIMCILLSVMVIGYPIYSLVRWSDQYLARATKAAQAQSPPEDV